MPPTATPEPPKLPMAPDRPASPSGDEQKWKLDVKKLLEGMDAKDRLQCLAMANRVRIYKRLLVYVYVQLRYFQIDVSSIPSFTAHLASLEGWDGPKSLCKHDAIRRAIWETLQTQGIQVKTNQFVHFLPEMLVLDENDIALKVTTIIRDQEQKQEFVALCMEEPVPVIGLLQMLLDHDLVPNESKMLLVQTLARFAKMSATYPNSLLLRGVKLQGTHPVAGGGYSDIWKGTLGSQSVALKAFRIFFNDTSRIKNKILKDFCHEAVMWRQLRHKNILPFYGVFQGDETFDRLCLVSPWSEAGNIVDFLTSHPDSDRILLLSDVVDGLCYLHSFDPPVVHGDLKGANIFVTHSGIACLGDFGLTRFRDSQDNNIWQSTTGNASGTSRWTAPELLASDVSGQNIRANRASDIYSFGCVCLEVFTGNPPFSEILREAVVVMAIIQKQTPQRPFGDCVKHGLDDSMWDMISQCWHADPNLRPTVLQVSQFFRGKMGSLKENRTTVDDFPGAPSESLGQYGFSDEYVSHMTLQLKDRNPSLRGDPNHAIPLIRAWNSSLTDHFYTTNACEMDAAIAKHGYQSEGVAAYIFATQEASTIPLYRLAVHVFVTNHFYTTSAKERDGAIPINYKSEGIAGYVYPSQTCGSVPLFRVYHQASTDHVYTTSITERDNFLDNLGYTDEGIAAYVIPAWS